MMNYKKMVSKIVSGMLSSYDASKNRKDEIHSELQKAKCQSIDSYKESQNSIEKIRMSIQKTKL